MKNLTRRWFGFMVVFAFASVISFFQINSYWADQNNFNGFFGFLGIGIVFGLAAVFCLMKVAKYGGGTGGGDSAI